MASTVDGMQDMVIYPNKTYKFESETIQEEKKRLETALMKFIKASGMFQVRGISNFGCFNMSDIVRNKPFASGQKQIGLYIYILYHRAIKLPSIKPLKWELCVPTKTKTNLDTSKTLIKANNDNKQYIKDTLRIQGRSHSTKKNYCLPKKINNN